MRTAISTARSDGSIRAKVVMRGAGIRAGFCVIVLMLLLAQRDAALAVPQKKQPPPRRAIVVYAMKKGDTLSALAANYLTGSNAVQIVRRLNRIADPRRIPIGLQLRVPLQMLRQGPIQATIRSFGGPVTITANGRAATFAAGARLSEGAIVQTGANAFISLALPDGTVVTMPSQTSVRLGWLRQTLLTGSIERRFDIEAGRVRAVVTPMKQPRSSFNVTTPVAVSAVRGTDFRVSYNPAANRATTEVLTGKVAVSNAKSPGALVPAGFGATEERAGGISAPIALLPAPRPVGPAGQQRDAIVSFTVQPVAGAAGYRLQIARDAGFMELVSERDSAEPRFSVTDLPNGAYFSRISAIDAAGLEGQSDVYGFQRRLHGISASVASGGKGKYLFRWANMGDGTYVHRFQLARCGEAQKPVIDQTNVANSSLVVSGLPAGTYCWRVQSLEVGGDVIDSVWSEIDKFTITK